MIAPRPAIITGRRAWFISAAAAAAAGAKVTLISGPVAIQDPHGVKTVHVETAADMLAAVERALPADLAIFCAAVADWRVKTEAKDKIKKQKGAPPPTLALEPNPDILASIAARKKGRPALVVGFAAETQNVLTYAKGKLASKGCDVIVANDVGTGTGVMGGDENIVHLVSRRGVETWPKLPKTEVAARLIAEFAKILPKKT